MLLVVLHNWSRNERIRERACRGEGMTVGVEGRVIWVAQYSALVTEFDFWFIYVSCSARTAAGDVVICYQERRSS